MRARICVSLLPKTYSEAITQLEEAEKIGSDLIEVRLDYLQSATDLSKLASHGTIPKIATILSGTLKKRTNVTGVDQQKLLLEAAKSGFEYVDVGLSSPKLKDFIKELRTLRCRPIVSFHDFCNFLPLSDLDAILKKEISCGAEVCKIVTTANKITDNLIILNFISQKSAKTNLVCFCMGELGRVSRLLSPLYGSYFTFASLKKGSETANGQFSLQEMKSTYKILE